MARVIINKRGSAAFYAEGEYTLEEKIAFLHGNKPILKGVRPHITKDDFWFEFRGRRWTKRRTMSISLAIGEVLGESGLSFFDKNGNLITKFPPGLWVDCR